MATLDHMKGMDALPRVAKQQVYYRNGVAVPVGYGPNGKPLPAIDPALRQNILDKARQHPPQAISADRTNPFGKEGSLAKSINKQLAGFEAYRQKQVNQAVADAAPKHARLIADGEDSTCLERLTWKDGIATATFFRGGQITYDYPMSRDQFVEWVSFGSLGRYGNENVFD
jgi:hypothetical protein